MQYQREYLSATQELKGSLDGRACKRKPEDLLEGVKLVVSSRTSVLLGVPRNPHDSDSHRTQVGKLKMEARALPAHTASQKLQEVPLLYLPA